MLDPGIHAEKGYEAFDTGSEEDVWIQTPDGKPYIGECWPGPVVFPDFLNKKTRAWWSKLVKEFVGVGVDGIWNDMNEPAVFKVRFLACSVTCSARSDALSSCRRFLH